MAKLVFLFLVAAAIFFELSLAESPAIMVQGNVYCHNCHTISQTSAINHIEGATVKLQCRHPGNNTIAHSDTGKTDKNGHYTLQLKNDHHQEHCEVLVVDTPLWECYETAGKHRARFIINSPLDPPVRIYSLELLAKVGCRPPPPPEQVNAVTKEGNWDGNQIQIW